MVHYAVPIPIGTELASTGIEWKGLRSRFLQKKQDWLDKSKSSGLENHHFLRVGLYLEFYLASPLDIEVQIFGKTRILCTNTDCKYRM